MSVLHQLSSRESQSPTNETIDIVFVHGLPGHYKQTWATPKFSWPFELAKDFPEARIFSLEYDFASSRKAGHNREVDPDLITITAPMLLQHLVTQRSGGAIRRPIIFIGHSIGGIIIKKVLTSIPSLINRTSAEAVGIFESTKGICFFSTPHGGSSRERWRQAISAVKSAIVSRNEAGDEHTLYPYISTTVAQTIDSSSSSFSNIANRMSIAILSFYEKKTTSINRGGLLIVGRDAALLNTANERMIACDADHLEIPKITDRDDNRYKEISKLIRKIINSAEDEPPKILALPSESTAPFTKTDIIEPFEEPKVGNRPDQERRLRKILRFDWLEESFIPDAGMETCDWFLKCPHYQQWCILRDGNFYEPLWICGSAGTGKTVLTKFLTKRLECLSKLKRHDRPVQEPTDPMVDVKPSFGKPDKTATMTTVWIPTYALAYYFDERDEVRSAFSSLTRSLLYNLLSLNRELFKHVYGKDIFDKSEFNSKDVFEALLAIFKDPNIGHLAILIDALDECRDPEKFEIIKELLEMPNIHVIITTRHTRGGIGFPSASTMIDLDLEKKRESTGKDCVHKACKSGFGTGMKKFVNTEVEEASRRGDIPPGFSDKFREGLLQKSPANFLWVRLAVRYVEVQESKIRAQRAVDNLPPNLESLLERCLESIGGEEILLQSLHVMMQAKAALSSTSLSFLVDTKPNQLEQDDLETIEASAIGKFEGKIQRLPLLQVRAGMVSLAHNSIKGTLKGLKSFSDLLLRRLAPSIGSESKINPVQGGDAHSLTTRFSFLSRNTNSDLASLCLIYLLAAQNQQRDPFNFLDYAAIFWTEHLREGAETPSDVPKALLTRAQSLFGSREMFRKWIERYMHSETTHKIVLFPKRNSPDCAAFTLAAFDLCHLLGDSFIHSDPEVLEMKDDRGYTPLHLAVANNSIRSIEWMLKLWRKHGPSVHSTELINGQFTKCPLYLAASYGNAEAVELLLAEEHDNPKIKHLFPSLYNVVSEKGHRRVFQVIWNRKILRSEGQDEMPEIRAALRAAISLELEDVFDVILKKFETSSSLLRDSSLIRAAIRSRSSRMFNQLVKRMQNAGENFDTNIDGHPRSLLHTAAEFGNEYVLEKLLSQNAKVDAQDRECRTALHLASKSGWTKACQLLLKANASPNLRDSNGRTPSHNAAEFGHDTLLQLLLKHGANVYASDNSGQTALHLAAEAGHEAAVRVLTDMGAAVDARDSFGRTPLHCAVVSNNVSVIWLMCDAGADLSAKDYHGLTPIHLAAKGFSDVVIHELTRMGADPNAKDGLGKTPLYHCCIESTRKSHKVFTALWKGGAKTDDLLMLRLPRKSDPWAWIQDASGRPRHLATYSSILRKYALPQVHGDLSFTGSQFTDPEDRPDTLSDMD